MSVLDKNHTVGEKSLQQGGRASRREFLKKLSILPVACPTDKPLGRRAAMAVEQTTMVSFAKTGEAVRDLAQWLKAIEQKLNEQN